MIKFIKKYWMSILLIITICVATVFGINYYKKTKELEVSMNNEYMYSFYQFVDYVDSMETYLAKASISSSPTHGAETLSYVWREANLAETYLTQIPSTSQGLSNASKFLNQVSDYSYSLSRKSMNNEDLTQEELDNLTKLHEYSVGLKNAVNELMIEINNGNISWKELNKKNKDFTQEVSNISQESFSNIEGTFDDYEGLIYDGAFSEHMTSTEKKGLTGSDISEDDARKVIEEFMKKENMEVNLIELSENGTIPAYSFEIKDGEYIRVAVSKKGGHIIFLDADREVREEKINNEEANKIGLEYLKEKGYQNMKETYYMKEENIITINYAYEQNGVICYPDLIKLKIALDNGEILGMESTGYLNCHEIRNLSNNIISSEEAKNKINNNLEIKNERLAVIPTEYNTEIYCWEFQGKIKENEFLIYINALTGKEENILLIINSENGILTT